MKQTMSKKEQIFEEKGERLKCCICGELIRDWGNNPFPIAFLKPHRIECCDKCNELYVVPIRRNLYSLEKFVESYLKDYSFEDILKNYIGVNDE